MTSTNCHITYHRYLVCSLNHLITLEYCSPECVPSPTDWRCYLFITSSCYSHAKCFYCVAFSFHLSDVQCLSDIEKGVERKFTQQVRLLNTAFLAVSQPS